MDIILLEQVENLGNIGDQVKVRSGYARNFLLPKGKATLATPENIAIFEERRAELERREAEEHKAAEARAATLNGLALQIKANAGPEGKLFGSLGTVDIVEACAAAGATVERSEIRLPEGPLKTLGEHEIEIHLVSDLNVSIRIEVIADGEAPPPIIIDDEPDADTADAADDGDDPAREDKTTD